MLATRMIRIAALFALIASCQYRNRPENGQQQCGPAPGQRCPDGYVCVITTSGSDAGKCFRDGMAPDVDGGAGSGGVSGRGGTAGTVDGGGGNVGGGSGEGGAEGGAGGTAPVACEQGKHRCGDACVSDRDPATCSQSCSACEAPIDGTATCDGTKCGGTCPDGKKLCAGKCINSSDACAGVCAAGRHDCAGLCADDTDVNSCGKSCVPCPTADNATATCSNGQCGLDCIAQHHRCGTSCKRDDDAGACGAACTVCPTDPNGTATCTAGNCGLTCKNGFHLCGGKCVANSSTASCGSSCTACPVPTGGESTCDGTSCGAKCPSGKKVCQGVCVDSTAACGQPCASGTHDCNGFCVSNAETNTCGSLCTPCALPAGAVRATCNGTSCGFDCASGYHKCGSGCVADSDATACGTSCTVCPTDPNGTALCSNGACQMSCKNGYHLCNGKCVSNSSPASCGTTSCSACVEPSGGSVTCDGTRCVPSCPAGKQNCGGTCIDDTAACNGTCMMANTHNCSGVCRSNDSTDSCGTRCTSCPQPPANGKATCNGTDCGIMCNGGYRNCAGTSLCIASAHPGCCSATDCTQGGANTQATCSSNTCSYPCASGFKACDGACIANSACCGAADCTAYANGACDLGSRKCAYQVRIDADKDSSGFVSTSTLSPIGAGAFRMGEGAGANQSAGYRSFLSFKRQGLPSNLTVTSAIVYAYQSSCSTGPADPYLGGHGNLYLQHAGYGASLSSNIYGAGISQPEPIRKVFSTNSTLEWKSADVTSWVQFDVANSVAGGAYWQQMVLFDPTTIDDGVSMSCTLATPTTANKPYLDVTFTVP